MPANKLGRTLGLSILAVAALSTVSALTIPVPDGRAPWQLIVAQCALLMLQAALYWYGERVRHRLGIASYVAMQATLVFAFGLSNAFLPVVVSLYVALTAEVVVLASGMWGSAPITVGAIVLFAVNAMVSYDLYQGATWGLLLAVTGVVTHAIAGLRSRTPVAVAVNGQPTSAATASNGHPTDLTQREREVLRALVSGARSSQIASNLGIAERTVKAHLASIYQKLGVDSRAAAVGVALQRRLVD